MFDSLRLFSWFNKEVVSGKKEKHLLKIQSLINKIEKDENSGNATLFKPKPDPSWFIFTIVLILPVLFVGLLISFGDSLINYLFNGTLNSILFIFVLIVLFVFIFYYSFFLHIIAPWWIRTHPKSYYIHFGKEGILRRDNNLFTFIPWKMIKGTNLTRMGVMMGTDYEPEHYLKLITTYKYIHPRLIKGYGMGIFFHDWIEYSLEDMDKMSKIIEKNSNR